MDDDRQTVQCNEQNTTRRVASAIRTAYKVQETRMVSLLAWASAR